MRFILSISFFFITCVGYGQYDSMLNKSFSAKRPLLVNFYENKLKIHEAAYSGKKTIIEELRIFGKKHDDPSLVTESDLAEAWLQSLESQGHNLQTRLMQEFIQSSVKNKDYISTARAHRMLGDLYWQKAENYQLAFENYFKNLETGKLLTDEEYPEKMVDYATIGYAFYSFKEYQQAILYLKEGLRHKPPNKLARVQSDIRNTLGLYYQKLDNLDSSDYYFNEILNNETVRHEEWKGIASGSLGYNQYRRGNYDKAIPFLKQDIAIAIKYNNPALAARSLVTFAGIYLKQNNIAEAEKLSLQAKQYIEGTKNFEPYEFLYPLLSKLYSAKGDFKKSQLYLDSSLWVKDSIERKFSTMQLARAQQKIESALRQQEISSLEQDKRNKITQRNILIGFLLLLSILALYIYQLIKRRHKQEQLVKDLYLEKKEKELLAAEQQLNDFALNFHAKSMLLEQLEAQLQLKGNEDKKLLEQLQQSTLLTDEQWSNFRQVFEKVHSGYLVRLKEKLPDLSPAEIRYMALAKLQFSNKEMAAALAISQQTVRVTAHRLRKKLHLPEEGSLAGLVDSI
jgi:DNA-binding CsgD family transcriptional regulator